MTNQEGWQAKLNKLARSVFGLQNPALVIFDSSEILLEQAVIIQVWLRLNGGDSVSIELLSPPSTLSPDLATLDWSWPGELPLEGGLLLDIPGRYQFAGNLFLRTPGSLTPEFDLNAALLENVKSITGHHWPVPNSENLIHLLTGKAEAPLRPPDLHQFDALLPPPAILSSPPNFQVPPPHDLTGQTVSGWPVPDTENIFHLLTETDDPSLTPPDMLSMPDDVWLPPPAMEVIPSQFKVPPPVDFSKLYFLAHFDIVVEDCFDFLTTGKIFGKNYGPEPVSPENITVIKPGDTQPEGEEQELCVHGLLKATCDLCQQTEARAKKRRQKRTQRRGRKNRNQDKQKSPTVDVFDLLLPFLYPPLDNNFDESAIFPPGKTLYGFQRSGSHFLATNDVALLADEMGLGKSVQAIFAMRVRFRRSRQPMSVLILSPKSVLKDWERKLQEWAPELRLIVIDGQPAVRHALWKTPAHVYLAGYDTVTVDVTKVAKQTFEGIILDEVQAIKSPKTARTKAVRKIDAGWRWGLSATPLENKAEDLVSIFAYLKPKHLTYDDAQNRSRLKNRIKPYFLRRRIKDVRSDVDLGEPVFDERWLELTPEQQRTYNQVFRNAQSSLKSIAKRSGTAHSDQAPSEFDTKRKVLAQITELKKICNFDPQTGKSCKADYLKENLGEIFESGEKVLIFSQYPNISLQPLAEELGEFTPDLFDGSLSHIERDRKIRKFQESDKTNVMLMSVKSGGVGITLTRANHVFFLDQWWNPAIGKQAVGRAYRIGQEKTVFVTTFCVANTIEEHIRDILQRKQQLFDEIIDDQSEEVYKSITTEELLELLDLVQFDVILTTSGQQIGRTIQVISDIVGLDYREARQLVQTLPATILSNVSRKVAEQAKSRLQMVTGVSVEIKSSYENE